MPGNPKIQFRDPDGETGDQIDYLSGRYGIEDEAKTIRKAVDTAYHEMRHPALYRLKDIGVYGAFVFAVLALSVVPFGYLTTAISTLQTWWLAASFVVLGAFWLSVIEGIRYGARWF